MNMKMLPGVMALEKRELVKALKANGWNVRVCSRALGISRGCLYEKMKRHDIKPQKKK